MSTQCRIIKLITQCSTITLVYNTVLWHGQVIAIRLLSQIKHTLIQGYSSSLNFHTQFQRTLKSYAEYLILNFKVIEVGAGDSIHWHNSIPTLLFIDTSFSQVRFCQIVYMRENVMKIRDMFVM